MDERNGYQYKILFMAFMLQMEKNGQQVVIHHDTIKEAQRRCDPKIKEDLWQWICNPLAKTYQFLVTKPKPESETTMAKAFDELWCQMEEEQNALRVINGEL